MDFAYEPDDVAFADELVAWLDVELPKFLEEWAGDDDLGGPQSADVGGRSVARRKDWQRRLHEGRWAAINWPRAWGGREATPVQNVIYAETMARYRAPGIYNANGIWQIGPMIIAWGTDEQQRRWLPSILDASAHWCQGFSEPQAGSDLANLRTTAIRTADGAAYVVNGEKIWISLAHIAKWGLFLFRTDPTAIERGRKHEGITAFVVDMETPGIECRPITDVTGERMFDEVRFTDVCIPESSRLGGEGEGWKVAMGTLGRERIGTASLAIMLGHDLRGIIAATRGCNPNALDDPDVRDRIARIWTQIELTKLLNYRALTKIIKGQPNWPEVPLAKLQWSHIAQDLAELSVDMLGLQGTLLRDATDAVDAGAWARLYSFQRFTTIGAGATEVQKNIIADRALLPRT